MVKMNLDFRRDCNDKHPAAIALKNDRVRGQQQTRRKVKLTL